MCQCTDDYTCNKCWIDPDAIQELYWYDLPQDLQEYPTKDEAPAFRERFEAWLTANDAYYYARPRESFILREAYDLARAAGNTRVLLEDMS